MALDLLMRLAEVVSTRWCNSSTGGGGDIDGTDQETEMNMRPPQRRIWEGSQTARQKTRARGRQSDQVRGRHEANSGAPGTATWMNPDESSPYEPARQMVIPQVDSPYEPTPQAWVRSDMDDVQSTSVSDSTVESRKRSATEIAERVCDSAWVESMTQRAVDAGTEPMWKEAKAHWDATGSQVFETVAECLEALPKAVRTAIKELTEALARAVGAPEWAAVTIGWVASSVPLPCEVPLQQGAQAIRLVAVGLSVEKGTLGKCACLPNLVQVRADEFIADSLTDELRLVARMTG